MIIKNLRRQDNMTIMNMLNPLHARLEQHLGKIYDSIELEQSTSDLATELLALMRLEPCAEPPIAHLNLWDQSDVAQRYSRYF